jgi:hypothetical protein
MAQSEKSAHAMCDHPAEYFSYSINEMFSLDPGELENMQLEVLRERFAQLRDRIPMLTTLIAKSGIDSIDAIEAAVPLLFDHAIYKSYPPSLLSKGRFDAMTRWLNKLTAHDLSGVDVSACGTIDEWIDTLDRDTPLLVSHSSGTSGTVSFLPIERDDFDRATAAWPVTFLQEFGAPQSYFGECPNLHLVSFEYRSSRRSAGRYNDFCSKYFAGSEDHMHALHPEKMSADMMYLAGKLRAAQASGKLDKLDISPQLLARRGEFARQQQREAEHIEPFFHDIIEKYAGERLFVTGFSQVLYTLAQGALEKGYRKIFSPDSILFLGGGSKGGILPDDWQDPVKALFGVDRIVQAYGMSEVMGIHPMCSQGHYHFLPWIIPYVLDPDTSESLPRTGSTTGRAAYFDLGGKAHWGGFISGDEITVTWDEPCPCGMKGAYMDSQVERYSEKRGGDDKINCAATAQAHEDALNFLLEL